MMDDRHSYNQLCEELRKHNYLYYVLDAPIIDDYKYDTMMRQIKAFEQQHPDWVTPDSPTQTVGHPVYPGHFQLVNRSIPMLSLDNVFSADEAIDWTVEAHSYGEDIGTNDYVEIVPEWKMDGLSLDLEYVFGELKCASTRGDGTQGENVTPNALMIEGIPKHIKTDLPIVNVRGEVVPRLADYAEINRALVESGKPPYANPRNYAAGSLRLKDAKVTKERKLVFVAHGPEYPEIEEDPEGDWYKDQAFLKDNGFLTADTGERFKHETKGITTGIPDLLEKCKAARPHYPFEVDGLVLKVVKHRHRKRLGFTSRFPRWARAYKFPASKGTTRLINVDRQVGRTGKLTPMARLEPVHVHGTTISNVTIHNLSELVAHQLFEGCEVLISRAGDVIPYLEERVTPLGDQKLYGQITHCPSCNTEVVIVNGKPSKESPEGSKVEYCPNETCGGRQLAHLKYAVSRNVLNIKGLGDELVEELVAKGVVNPAHPLDLLGLVATDYLKIDLSSRMADKLAMATFVAYTNVTLQRVIAALGISNVAEGTSERLARSFESLDALSVATVDQLVAIEDIGGITAQSIVEFFDTDNRLPFEQSVWKRQIGGRILPRPAPINALFKPGTTMVVTGSNFGGKTRKEMELYFKSNGAKVTSAVTGNTTTLYCGTKYTAHKLDTAKRLGIPYVVYNESGVVEQTDGLIEIVQKV